MHLLYHLLALWTILIMCHNITVQLHTVCLQGRAISDITVTTTQLYTNTDGPHA